MSLLLVLVPLLNTLLLATLAWFGRKKLIEIHVLVNSRLQIALGELAELKAKLGPENK